MPDTHTHWSYHMAITNFDFPGVTLTQVFEETQASTERTLSVAVVGTVYKTHKPDVETEAVKLFSGLLSANASASIPVDDGNELDSAYPIKLTIKNGLLSTVEDGISGTYSTGTLTFTDNNNNTEVGDTVVVVDKDSTKTTYLATVISVDSSSVTCIFSGAEVPAEAASYTCYPCKEFSGELSSSSSSSSNADYTVNNNNNNITITNSKIKSGDIYVDYREIVTKYNKQMGSAGTYTEVLETLGYPCADNPMALAAYAAVAAGSNAVVYFIGVEAETANAYAKALDYLDKYDNIYSIVPCSTDAAVIRACLTACVAISTDGESTVRRALWYGIDTNTDSTDKITELIAQRKARTTSERACCIWADGLLFNGEKVPNFVGAAAAAGMRSYEPCHRPLSNLGYSFFSIEETDGFTNSELKRLGAEGIWIIANNVDGLPVNKRQVTTAVSNNLNRDEESIVANADDIALSMCRIGRNLVGCSNINDDLLESLRYTIVTLLEGYAINKSGSAYIGPQLIEYELVSLYQDTVQRDHVYANITITPPKPFNRFAMTLRII